MAKLHVKTGDKVKVIAGNHKGKVAVIKQVLIDKNRVVLEGVNMVKRHLKPTSTTPDGKIEEKEAPIHISNVMHVEGANNEVTRIGRRVNKAGKTERYSKKTDKAI